MPFLFIFASSAAYVPNVQQIPFPPWFLTGVCVVLRVSYDDGSDRVFLAPRKGALSVGNTRSIFSGINPLINSSLESPCGDACLESPVPYPFDAGLSASAAPGRSPANITRAIRMLNSFLVLCFISEKTSVYNFRFLCSFAKSCSPFVKKYTNS